MQRSLKNQVITNVMQGDDRRIRNMKQNEAAKRTPEPCWYRTSPINLTSKQIGKPPTGKGKVKRGTLIEADKEIFDRLLNVASTSMFGDDEDHSRQENEICNAAPDINGSNRPEERFLIPSLRVSCDSHDGILMSKHVSKSIRKVSFSENLELESSSKYSNIHEKSGEIMPIVVDLNTEIINGRNLLQSVITEDSLEKQRTYSDFFDLSDTNTCSDDAFIYRGKETDDYNTQELSRLGYLPTGFGDTTLTMITDVSNLHLDNGDDSPINITGLLHNLSKYDIPPPIPPLVLTPTSLLPKSVQIPAPVITRMKDMRIHEDDEFSKFSIYLRNVSRNRIVSMEHPAGKRRDAADTDDYVLTVSDISNTHISTDDLEDKVMMKVCATYVTLFT